MFAFSGIATGYPITIGFNTATFSPTVFGRDFEISISVVNTDDRSVSFCVENVQFCDHFFF